MQRQVAALVHALSHAFNVHGDLLSKTVAEDRHVCRALCRSAARHDVAACGGADSKSPIWAPREVRPFCQGVSPTEPPDHLPNNPNELTCSIKQLIFGITFALMASNPTVRIGILNNPLSGGNRSGLKKIREAAAAAQPEVLQREVQTPSDVSETLADFARREVNIVVVNGGDGTVQAALAAIFLFFTIRQYIKGKIRIRTFIFWEILWIILFLTGIFPSIYVSIVKSLGMATPIHFVTTFSIIFLFIFIFMIYQKINELEKKIVEIVQYLAISESENENKK